MGYRLGVDLGTTYTAAAVNAGGRVEMLGLGIRAMQVPSVVFVRDDGEIVVGEAAEQQGAADPARALGANLFGALCGGLLESMAMAAGFGALYLVAIGLYALGLVAALATGRGGPAAPPA